MTNRSNPKGEWVTTRISNLIRVIVMLSMLTLLLTTSIPKASAISEPVADFSANPTSGAEPLTVYFTDTTPPEDGIVSWEWDFGDGETSTEQNPVHVYAQGERYTVSLTVVNGGGIPNTTTKENYITVFDTGPMADFSAIPLSGDEPLTVTFADTSVSYDEIVSWLWDFGDGQTSTQQNPVHEYAHDGVYTVSLKVTDSDGSIDTETKTDYIDVLDTGPTALFSATPLLGGEPLTVYFTDTTPSEDGIVSWEWDFGDGQTSTEQNPVHVYAQSERYTVSLTVVNGGGIPNTTTKENYITVFDTVPAANFLASPLSEGEPLTVTFTDTSVSYDQIVSWEWDFDDGQTSTEQDPVHEYVQDGDYTVSLTVTDSDGSSSTKIKTEYIIVSDTGPTAGFSASPLSGTEPLTVTFADTSASYDGIISWLWDFGDGQTSTDQNPVHVYTQSSVYTVSLTVTDGDGSIDTETKTEYIDVFDTGPAAGFSASPLSGGEPLTVTFTDTSVSYDQIVSWEWDFGDGQTSTLQNPDHVYTQSSVYTVSLTVTDGDGSIDTETKTGYITVYDTGPVADFSATPLSGNEPLTVSFTDTSASYDGIVSWLWVFGDGQSSTLQNPVHEYVQDGDYTVSLTVTDSDGSSSTKIKTEYIIVYDTGPAAGFSASPLSGGEPLTVSFTDTSTADDGIVSWLWDFGDGQTSTLQNPVHVYTQSSIYTVSLTVTDGDGSIDTETKTGYITVYDTGPVVDFSASPLSGGEPLTVSFTDTSTSYDGIISWLWNFGDGQTSTLQNPDHVYTQSSVYTVSLTVTDSDGSSNTETKTGYITVSDTGPAAGFSATPLFGGEPMTVSFTDTSVSYDDIVSWEWNFDDGQTSTDQNPYHVYTQDGVYTVSLTVTDSDGSIDTETKTGYITVYDTGPVADFSAAPLSGNEPLTVSFTDASTSYDGIVSWLWDFGDGQTGTQQNPNHEYTQNGVYTVSLTVTETDADSDFKTKIGFITVSDTGPVAHFSASPLSGGEPLTVSFTDTSTSYDGIVSWLWNFGDGQTSTLQNPDHEYAQDGVYTVSLTVTDSDGNGDTETKADYITVSDTGPAASFSATPLAGGEPLMVVFTDTSASSDGIVSWLWDFGDGQTGTQQNPHHEYAQNGRYTVSLTVTDSDGSIDTETKTDYITVYDIGSTADFSATPLSGTEPLTVSFTDTSISYEGIVSWLWNFGDGQTSTQQNPDHVYTRNGVYTVSLTVTEADNGSDVETKIGFITVSDARSVADFSAVPLSGDEPLTVSFTDTSSSNDDITSWLWDFGDGQTSSAQNPNHEYIQDGVYTVSLTVTDSDGSSSTETKTDYITVSDTGPVADFSASPLSGGEPLTVSYTDTSASSDGIVSWLWNFGDGRTSNEQNPDHEYAQDGVYTVSLTVIDSDGSSDTELKTDYITANYVSEATSSWMGFAAIGGLVVLSIMTGTVVIRRRV